MKKRVTCHFLVYLSVLFPAFVSEAQTNRFTIYIDSVPSGAEVFLLEPDPLTKQNNRPQYNETMSLGKTPLVTTVSKGKIKLSIRMIIEDYVTRIEQIPELKEWLDRFKMELELGAMPGLSHHLIIARVFDWETGESSAYNDLSTGSLIAIAPQFDLNLPEENRVCVFFLPKGKSISSLFSLMPPRGTYYVNEEVWEKKLTQQFHFTSKQAGEALESLSRIGKSYTVIRDHARDTEIVYSLTILGPPSKIIRTGFGERPIVKGLLER